GEVKMKHMGHSTGLPADNFHKYNKITAYGDDNVLSSNCFNEKWNPETICDYFATKGISLRLEVAKPVLLEKTQDIDQYIKAHPDNLVNFLDLISENNKLVRENDIMELQYKEMDQDLVKIDMSPFEKNVLKTMDLSLSRTSVNTLYFDPNNYSIAESFLIEKWTI
ncbi:12389_t:CDS:2, partial [Gigaspora rosea]